MSPRVNLPPGRTVDELTVGQLRAVLASSDESLTIGEALDVIIEASRVTAAHEIDTRAYGEYVSRRQARHAQALEVAAAAVKVDPRMASADGWHRRQEARLEAAEQFDIREPLLEFRDWIEHDRPEIHQVGAIRRALRTVTRQEIAH
jgi:hypothetical protein